MRRKTIIALIALMVMLLFMNVIFTVLVALTGDITTGREPQLSIYSDDWNGLSSMKNDLEDQGYNISTIISNPLILDGVEHPQSYLYICIGPEKGYDRLQADAIIRFASRGGKVLIADDRSNANSISRQLGVVFSGKRIWSWDFVHNYSFISIKATVGSEIYDIILNGPTSLILTGSSHPFFYSPEEILMTSPETFEDSNDNGKIDFTNGGDFFGVIPVGVKVVSKSNAGSIHFIADTGFCINYVWSGDVWRVRCQNSFFTLRLIEEILGGHGTIIFDESRHIQSNPLSNTIFLLENVYFYLFLQNDRLIGLIFLTVTLNTFAIIYALTRNPIPFRNHFDISYNKAFMENNPDRLNDLQQILLRKIKSYFDLYIIDGKIPTAYNPLTNTKHDLSRNKDLLALLQDADLVHFMQHPSYFDTLDKLMRIVKKIDEFYPLKE